MKDMRRKLIAATLGAAAIGSGCGHVAAAPAAAGVQADPSQARQDEKVLVTGSRIPQRVETSAGLPATTSPVRIYSRRDLTGTGRPLTADALRQLDPSIP